MNIYPFVPTEDAYATIVAIQNAAWPEDPTSVAVYQHSDATHEEKYFFERYLIAIDGKTVGFAEIMHTYWSFRPNKYFIDWDLLPEHLDLNEPILHAFEQKLLARGATQIQVDTREDKPLKQLLLDNGYEILMREPVSHLVINEFDFSAYDSLDAHLASQGITIQTVTQLEESDPANWAHKLEEAQWVIDQDVPSTEPFTREPFDVWCKLFDSPRTSKDLWFVGVAANGDYVGMSRLKTSDGDKLYTGLTGVKREWRRKGIATALKVAAIRAATQTHYTLIETDNEENNPMYDLNMQLGYQPQPAWLEMHKAIGDVSIELNKAAQGDNNG